MALDISVGNSVVAGNITDTRSNFAVVDKNNQASVSANLTSFSYYASNKNPFRFLIVDSGLVVKWISEEITPSVIGVNTFTPPNPVHVDSGWNVGIYFVSTGTIPFNWGGALSSYTDANLGVPAFNTALAVGGTSARTYSFVATGEIACATIDSGTIKDSNGNTISKGFDKWGYNYQAHMFNGYANNYSRPPELKNTGDKLVMKWSDAWIANVDCNGDGKLDRGLVDGVVSGISKGWLTNHYNGTTTEGKRYTDFYKIVWTGPETENGIWGQYTVIQEVLNDSTAESHGLVIKDGVPGFGLNDKWTQI